MFDYIGDARQFRVPLPLAPLAVLISRNGGGVLGNFVTEETWQPTAPYRVTTVDSDDQKLLRHLRRHERISNEDVRNYLDCDIATARNRLTRLRRRGLIDFAPDSPRRGPHVVYVRTQRAMADTDQDN